ncbi:TlpA family protein disulfide reductase [Chitinophaga solisilvae]|uniref:TlpA family protein disulfide reductase n=1 Tax=Chitinophaga solisilvae TaxID=1233460 RepID=UPI00136C34AD|nr:TlpA disulfide reductase family protein [Chitinophaga solisilvae]
MKKINLCGLLPLVACLALSARAAAGPAPVSSVTVIEGKVPEKIQKVTLYTVIEGHKSEIATSVVDEHQTFAFAVPAPKEGFYYIGTGSRGGDARIYLKAGERLQLQLDGREFKVEAGSAENKALQKWNDQVNIIAKPAFSIDSTTYMSYFPKLETFVAKVPGFKKEVNTSNKKFNERLKYTMDMDVERAALQFIFTPRTKHPDHSMYPAYYKQLMQPQKYCDAGLLQDGEGADLIRLYSTLNIVLNNDKGGKAPVAERLNTLASLFCNDSIKGLAVTDALSTYRTFEGLTEAMAPVKQYVITDVQKKRYLDYEKSVRKFAAGESGLNFSGEDITGKKIAFSELKGKVVVVDVWATWCGPCKAEMPHMEKLIEEMNGKNVVFVGCSVDEVKDKEKWSTFVKEKEMKGLQLFMSGWSDITKFYGITGIPRFMVFDQKGNIVSIDAPRPSTPELKAMIEKELARG